MTTYNAQPQNFTVTLPSNQIEWLKAEAKRRSAGRTKRFTRSQLISLLIEEAMTGAVPEPQQSMLLHPDEVDGDALVESSPVQPSTSSVQPSTSPVEETPKVDNSKIDAILDDLQTTPVVQPPAAASVEQVSDEDVDELVSLVSRGNTDPEVLIEARRHILAAINERGLDEAREAVNRYLARFTSRPTA